MKQFHEEPFAFNTHSHVYGSAKPSFIKADDGNNLAYYHIATSTNPKAILVFIHGAGAHCYMSDYQQIGVKLIKSGIDCYFIDIRGHGNSDGIRGATPSKERVWMDIKYLITFIKSKCKDVPLYLAGHSAGAGTVINYATWKKRLECDGYLLISPYLGWRAKSYRKSMMEDTFATAIIRYFVCNALSFGMLFGNKTSVYYNYPKEILQKDPLIVSSITCNMGKVCTLWNPKKQFNMIKRPIGLFIGSEDELFDPEKVTAYQRYLSKDIKHESRFVVIPNEKHLTVLSSIDVHLQDAINVFCLKSAST
jgi:pimeloyl-ACP methyl ester carboxylesterase